MRLTSTQGTNGLIADGYVTHWISVVPTPDFVSLSVSPPTAGRIGTWYYPTSSNNESFGQYLIKDLKPGRNYILSFMAIRDFNSDTGVFGNIIVRFRDKYGNFYPIPNRGWGSLNMVLPGSDNIYSCQPTNSWQRYSKCFTSTKEYDLIFFYSDFIPTTYPQDFWVRIDDVEMYEIIAKAGPDKTIDCDSNPCVYIGTECLTPPLHITRTFTWYEAGNPAEIGNNPVIQVCPTQTTTYYLKVEMDSCEAWDTVIVEVKDLNPPDVDLGNDTVICGPFSLLLDAGYNAKYKYKWSTNATTSSITIDNGGTYFVEVTDTTNKCKGYDTITIISRPNYVMLPDDTITVCDQSKDITLSVVPVQYDSVRWSTGATGLSISVPAIAGIHWVIVWDSLCFDTGFFVIRTFGPPFLYLGPDDTICYGTGRWICDSNLAFYSKGLIAYRWLIESFNDSICLWVNQTGLYKLRAYSLDTLCMDTASIRITVLPQPQVSCPSYEVCENDPPFALQCSPQGVYYTHPKLINGNVFDPAAFGAGLHHIDAHYQYSTKPHCVYDFVCNVIVHQLPWVFTDSFKAVCITDPPFRMPLGGDTGGVYTIDGHPSDSIFVPSDWGTGMHLSKYKVSNEYGCTDSALLYVLVHDTFSVWMDTTNNGKCWEPSVTISVYTSKPGPYYYEWNTGESTQSIIVSVGGLYCVKVWDSLHGCYDSAAYRLHICNCCNAECNPENMHQDIFDNGTTTLPPQVYYIDHDIYIRNNATLNIINSTIIMRNCSRIIVESNFSGPGPGHLNIENSKIGYCNWKGIEVWGNWDACPDNYIAHGQLSIKNSEIEHADIGVFVGKRNSYTHDIQYSGGIIKVNNSTFENNYVDIMFSEWSFAYACCGAPWQDSITGNTFKTLSRNSFCDDYVDRTLYSYDSFFANPSQLCKQSVFWVPPSNPPVPVRCHFIDLSPYVDFWLAQPQYWYLCPWLVCTKAYWESGTIGTPPSILDNNTFYGNGQIPPCSTIPPHDKYK